ncbi:MAG: MSMEG_0565 family glycosyltransferase [Cyanobacteria bacterium P01_E01_bin.35]
MMRIALFTYSTKPRGGVIHTLELAEALQKEGHDVCVYALDKDRIGFHRPVNCPHKLVPTKPAADRQLLLQREQDYLDGKRNERHLDPVDELIKQRIQEFIDYLLQEEERYDIYHSQDCISSNALQVLRDKGLISHFIRTAHHIDEFNSPYLQACHDRSILEPDLCLCVSQYWQQQLREQYQIEAPVIINGVDTQRFSRMSSQLSDQIAALKQQLGINGSSVYLTIGGIEPRKNSVQLLQAFIEILKTHPQAQLIIAGGETLFDYEPYRLEFFNLAQQHQLEIGKSLLLPGVVSEQDLPIMYHCADAFVFPSVKEGWGLVLLEAIASGLPILTSNIPPFTEFLTSETALLVDPNSSRAIANGMLEILNNNLAQRLINNSETIATRYSWQRSAQIHLDIYQELVS